MRPQKAANESKKTIDDIITELMKRRKKLCRFEAVESDEYDILVTDHAEEIEKIDDAVEHIEPLRDIIDGQLQFMQPGCDPLKAEAAQRRIDDALAEAKKIELWMTPIIVGCDSLKPIPNVSESMMLEWAAEETWPKAIAISRVVSSKYSDINIIMKTMMSLLSRLTLPKGSCEKKSWDDSVGSFERDGVTYVWPMVWLKWCDENGFNASPVLWNAVNAHRQGNKVAECCDQYPGAEPEDITRICDLDGELDPIGESTVLFDEYCLRTDKLNQDGWDIDRSKFIGTKMIEKGSNKVELCEAKGYMATLTKSDPEYITKKKETRAEIARLEGEIEKINKGMDGSPDTQSTASKLKNSKADERQVALIEKVRELMQRELDTTWPDGKLGLKICAIKKHYTILKSIYGDTTAENMAGKTKPSHLKRLGIKTPLPK